MKITREDRMICPECRSEYPAGIVACRDCREVLVEPEELEEGPRFLRFVCVAMTFNMGDIALIRSVFDVEDVTYHLQGEYFNLVRPLADPVRVLVEESDVGRARDLLSRFDLAIGAVGSFNTYDEEDGHEA